MIVSCPDGLTLEARGWLGGETKIDSFGTGEACGVDCTAGIASTEGAAAGEVSARGGERGRNDPRGAPRLREVG